MNLLLPTYWYHLFWLKKINETVLIPSFMLLLLLNFLVFHIPLISEADAEGCHCCHCSTPKKAYINFQTWVFFSKNVVNRSSNLSESSWGRHCFQMLSSAGGTFIHVFSFLTQFAISCNVLSVLASSDN